MRIFLWLLCLFLLVLVGFGGHLALEQDRRLKSFSATTTAIVLDKRLEEQENQARRRPGETRTIEYEPIVKFQFEARGRQFTSDNIFPEAFRVGGNPGRFLAKATLDKFEIGEETTAYYNPDAPKEACLIRRPSLLPYSRHASARDSRERTRYLLVAVVTTGSR